MIQKVGLLGSVLSIISAFAVFFPQASIGESQTSYGINSPNIKSGGSVNINYNSSQRGETYNYIKSSNGGGTILISTPSWSNFEVVCNPEAGSKVEYLSEKAENAFMVWVQVKVISGTCQGKVGWIGKDNYRVHNG